MANKEVSSMEKPHTRHDVMLEVHQRRIQREVVKAFGETVEEQRESFEEQYVSSGTTEKLRQVLRGRSINLGLGALRKTREKLGIPVMRGHGKLEPQTGARIKNKDLVLVNEAREDGRIKGLTRRQREYSDLRFPAEGEAETLEKIGLILQISTREGVRKLELRTLRRLKRLKEIAQA